MQSTPIIAQKMENSLTLQKINAEITATTDAIMEERETYLVMTATTINVANPISAVGQ